MIIASTCVPSVMDEMGPFGLLLIAQLLSFACLIRLPKSFPTIALAALAGAAPVLTIIVLSLKFDPLIFVMAGVLALICLSFFAWSSDRERNLALFLLFLLPGLAYCWQPAIWLIKAVFCGAVLSFCLRHRERPDFTEALIDRSLRLLIILLPLSGCLAFVCELPNYGRIQGWGKISCLLMQISQGSAAIGLQLLLLIGFWLWRQAERSNRKLTHSPIIFEQALVADQDTGNG